MTPIERLESSLKRYLPMVCPRQFLRFVVVGLANTFLTYVIYLVALQVFEYRIAYAFAYVTSVVFMTVMNIRYSFLRIVNAQGMTLYALYYAGYGLLHLGLIHVLVAQIGMPAEWAPLVTIAVLIVPHFLVSRALITKITPPRNG